MSCGVVGLVLAEPILEILSSAEGSALAREDDDPQRRFGLEPFKDTANVLLHGVCHRVELLGPIEGHLEHMACRSGEDEVGAHLGQDELGRGHGNAGGLQLVSRANESCLMRLQMLCL